MTTHAALRLLAGIILIALADLTVDATKFSVQAHGAIMLKVRGR